METSLGAVLAAALLDRRLTWCIGARFSPPPVEYHAWAELPGHGPVGEYTVAGWHYLTGMTIPGRRPRIHQPTEAVVAHERPAPRRSEQ